MSMAVRSPHPLTDWDTACAHQISWDYYESANAQFTTMIYNASKVIWCNILVHVMAACCACLLSR